MLKKSITLLLVLTVITVGCATTSGDGSRAKKGAGMGAFFGALAGVALGVATGQDTSGIVKRAAIGAAAGAAIGYGIGKAKDKKLASRDDAAERFAYHSSQGNFLALETVSVAPVNAKPGSDVQLTITYTVLVPKQSSNVSMVYQNALYYGDEKVHDFGSDSKTVKDGGGTVEISYPITLPDNAPAGTYAFRSSVGIKGTPTTKAGSTNLYISAS